MKLGIIFKVDITYVYLFITQRFSKKKILHNLTNSEYIFLKEGYYFFSSTVSYL